MVCAQTKGILLTEVEIEQRPDQIDGAYASYSAPSLHVPVWLAGRGHISALTLRLYFAYLLMNEARRASERLARAQNRGPSSKRPKFTLSEAKRIVRHKRATLKDFGAANENLKRLGLPHIVENDLVFPGDLIENLQIDSDELKELNELYRVEEGKKRPSIQNSVGERPVPRRVLTFLARHQGIAMAAVVVGFLVRCVYRREQRTNSVGRVKNAWLERVFPGVRARNLRKSCLWLREKGWISEAPLPKEQWWAVNYCGTRYQVNLSWKPPCMRLSEEAQVRGSSAIVSQDKLTPDRSSEQAENTPDRSAAIYSNQETSLKEKTKRPFKSSGLSKENQVQGAAGVFEPALATRADRTVTVRRKCPKQPEISLPPVNPRKIEHYDLESPERTDEIYRYYVRTESLSDTRENRILVHATALKALREWKEPKSKGPGALFYAVVKRSLWEHVPNRYQLEAERRVNKLDAASLPAADRRARAKPKLVSTRQAEKAKYASFLQSGDDDLRRIARRAKQEEAE